MKKRADNLYYRVGIYGIHDKINNKIYVGKTLMNFGDMLGETVAYIGNITAYRRWKYI